MYSTFPPGAIPGIAPGHLFASTPYGSSGPFLGPHSASSFLHHTNHLGYLGSTTSAQKLNFSNPDHSGTTAESNHGSSYVPASYHQEMFLLVQTVYHQQNVLQSQMSQLCLAVQNLQSSMSLLLSTSAGANDRGMATFTQPASQQQQYRSPHNVVAPPPQERGPSAEQRSTPQQDHASVATEPIVPRPTTPAAQVQPTHLFVAPSSASESIPLDPNPRRSPSKRAGLASPPRQVVAAPTTTAVTNAIFQDSFTKDDRLPSEVSRSSTPRPIASGTAHQTSVPPSPQQVLVSWDPKKYSRSSSVGSGSHNTSGIIITAQQQQVPTVVLGGTRSSGRSASQQSIDQHDAARHRQYHPHEQSYVDDRSIIDQHLHHQSSSTASVAEVAEPYPSYSSQQSSYLPRHAPKILERVFAGSSTGAGGSQNSSASDVRAHPGVLASRYTAPAATASSSRELPPRSTGGGAAAYPSYHDVSLSDDGYMSMDSAQYMQRFHLK
jgi:hypothetical protein